MFASLSARIAGIGLVVIVALASLAGLLADAARQTQVSFAWTNHSALVIETTRTALGELREVESGQRGFVITHDRGYARSFAADVASAQRHMAQVVALTSDNPVQNRRARALARLMAERIAVLRQPLTMSEGGEFVRAAAFINMGRGRELMDATVVRAQAFLDQEQALQTVRAQAAERRLVRGRRIAIAGALAVALIVGIGFALLVRSIRHPLDTIIQAMTDLGEGRHGHRIEDHMDSREFTHLAHGYNNMADRLERAVAESARSEARLQVANGELHRNGEALRERGDVIELLGAMAHRMQAARTDDELAAIIRVFVPRVLPDAPGALYAHNNSRNLLVPIVAWGGVYVPPDGFSPDRCWALRRGQSHGVAEPGCDIVCGHADAEQPYHCEPLLAGGEVVGVLYLAARLDDEHRFRMALLGENIASALVNHRLQRSLREQTIRDPLTGLFNRRYMEEALSLEIARAARSGAPLSLVMCDVDHFKRFNDDFGHDAGDAVLKAVAAEMRSRFRDGDVVCRFGGEEFTVIAPGTTADALMARVEVVRRAVGDLNVRLGGRTLGTSTMSFGVATWQDGMAKDGSTLVQAADAALYQAKREGRNRVLVSALAA